jgi:lactoylglutathione lyase
MRKGISIPLFTLLLQLSLWGTPQKPVFDHTALFVTDLKKSVAFYKDVIGLDTIPDPFRDGEHAFLSLGPGSELHLIAGADWKEAPHMNIHLALRIPSVESFILRLEKAGITYVNARGKQQTLTIRPDGVKQVYFQDPDGYWIEINDARK